MRFSIVITFFREGEDIPRAIEETVTIDADENVGQLLKNMTLNVLTRITGDGRKIRDHSTCIVPLN